MEKNLEIALSNKQTKQPISSNTPTFQDMMSRIQEASVDVSGPISYSKMSQEEFQKEVENLPTLLQKDKLKAQRIIGHLVSSAKEMTTTIASSLSSAPIHPYERLIYDYLGANFVPPSIEQYTIPVDFNPVFCVRELEKVSRKTSELEMTHYACISAEAMRPTFDGTFDAENLNNIFAVPSTDADGKMAFVINKERLAEHLKFAEMVKNIPTEYVVKNPLVVAKIILTEFIRIHKVEDHEISGELVSDSQFSMQDVMNNPFETTKKLLNNYQLLNGGSANFDIAAILESYERLTKSELLQNVAPVLKNKIN